jgi:hypothetical protein
MDAGDCQNELGMMLAMVAGDLAAVRTLIDGLDCDDARRLLLGALLRVRSLEAAIEFMGIEET